MINKTDAQVALEEQYEMMIAQALRGVELSDEQYHELKSYGLPVQLKIARLLESKAADFDYVMKAYNNGDI